MVSNSRNKIHQTWEQPFRGPLYNLFESVALKCHRQTWISNRNSNWPNIKARTSLSNHNFSCHLDLDNMWKLFFIARPTLSCVLWCLEFWCRRPPPSVRRRRRRELRSDFRQFTYIYFRQLMANTLTAGTSTSPLRCTECLGFSVYTTKMDWDLFSRCSVRFPFNFLFHLSSPNLIFLLSQWWINPLQPQTEGCGGSKRVEGERGWLREVRSLLLRPLRNSFIKRSNGYILSNFYYPRWEGLENYITMPLEMEICTEPKQSLCTWFGE